MSSILPFLIAALCIPIWSQTQTVCPFMSEGTPPTHNATIPQLTDYNEQLANLNISAVFEDIFELLSTSDDCWPADSFNGEASYGPLFIRLAWHCSGTFREIDNVGGCSGGRQRFPPEASWPDNVN
eukprot:CAMPEP_0197049902 /NCGR_PEP_ID=MMETSP1384-20130603/24939_1 /TAXON_ID=29189 /ORGANISM="Ammonia sp." /LENGTH=125 /DNA_ID=CAMNT_0042482251 /DNA_START=73 /DNA_END=447 /DNA_ORIENTATION=+